MVQPLLTCYLEVCQFNDFIVLPDRIIASQNFISLGAAQQVQGPRASTTMGRASMTLQPVSSVQTLVRTQSPSSSQSGPVNHVRAPSPAGQPRTVVTARSTISAGKPTQTRSEVARPIVLPSTPNRPLTLTPTTQVSIILLSITDIYKLLFCYNWGHVCFSCI